MGGGLRSFGIFWLLMIVERYRSKNQYMPGFWPWARWPWVPFTSWHFSFFICQMGGLDRMSSLAPIIYNECSECRRQIPNFHSFLLSLEYSCWMRLICREARIFSCFASKMEATLEMEGLSSWALSKKLKSNFPIAGSRMESWYNGMVIVHRSFQPYKISLSFNCSKLFFSLINSKNVYFLQLCFFGQL